MNTILKIERGPAHSRNEKKCAEIQRIAAKLLWKGLKQAETEGPDTTEMRGIATLDVSNSDEKTMTKWHLRSFKAKLLGLFPVNPVENTNLFLYIVNKFLLDDIISYTTYKLSGSETARQLLFLGYLGLIEEIYEKPPHYTEAT